jgi:lincosamide nucleotidyltransferase A/C/D/E
MVRANVATPGPGTFGPAADRHHLVVRADQVLRVLDRLAKQHVTAWVDGGWGVDALIGRQTREHQDLDLVVDADAVDHIRDLLLDDGFEVVRDWLPTAMAFSHSDGREVDLHPVEFTPDGGGDQIQLDGTTRWHYQPPVTGRIAGRPVACCSLDTQIASHLGYEPDDNDRADMLALAERFGCELPEPYRRSNERP